MKRVWLIFTLFLLVSLPVFADTLEIIHVTDVHFRKEQPQKLQQFVEDINKLNDIDFVVFSGDNIDKSKPGDLTAFLEITQNIKKPYYICMGNHDAYSISGISKQSYMLQVSEYNKNQPSSDFNFYFSPKRGIMILLLDGVTPYAPSSHGYFSTDTLEFFDEFLTKNKKSKVLVFQHFPLITPYDNASHSILEAQNYEKVINEHNNVAMIASGHYHANKDTLDSRGIHHISTTSLGKADGYKRISIDYSRTGAKAVKINNISTKELQIILPQK